MANSAGQDYGGFWARFLAYLVDSVIFFTLLFVLAAVAAFLGPLGVLLIGAACLVGPILYWGVMQASARQATFGKSLLGMKVTDADGQRMSLVRSLARELAKYVSAIPLMLGFILAGFTGRKQALHDMIASTVVVRESRGHVMVALVVGLFGWMAPAAVVMVLGVGLFAGMMGFVGGGMMQQAMKQAPTPAQRQAAPKQIAQRAPVSAPQPPRPFGSAKDVEAVLATELKGFDKPATTRAGPVILELSTTFPSSFWIKAYAPPLDEFGGSDAVTITLTRVADSKGAELYDPKNSLEGAFFQRVSLKPQTAPAPHLGGTRQVSLRSGATTTGLSQVDGTVKVKLPVKPLAASFGAGDVGKAQTMHGVQVTLKSLKGKEVEIEAAGAAERVVATRAYGADGSPVHASSTSSGGGHMKFGFDAPVSRVEVVVAEAFAERAFPFTLTKTSVAGAMTDLPRVQAQAPEPKPVLVPVAAKSAAVPVSVASESKPTRIAAAPRKRADAPPPVAPSKLELPAAVAAVSSAPQPKFNDLMTAVLYRDPAAVRELLAMGKWPDKTDSHGLTPLAVAAMLGDREDAELLLKAGADAARALAVARERGDSEMAGLLQRYAK